jgi:hypothetical protein
MGKDTTDTEFHGTRRHSHGSTGSYNSENDPQQRQLGDYGLVRQGAAGGKIHKPVPLPPHVAKRLAETLIPVIKQVATAMFPPLGPLIDLAYTLYAVYQNREMLAEVAQKISDEDFDGLAIMAAKEIAKKGVEVVADSVAANLADKSAERLKEAGLFDQLPEAEGYYHEFVKEEVSRLIDENGEDFVEKL